MPYQCQTHSNTLTCLTWRVDLTDIHMTRWHDSDELHSHPFFFSIFMLFSSLFLALFIALRVLSFLLVYFSSCLLFHTKHRQKSHKKVHKTQLPLSPAPCPSMLASAPEILVCRSAVFAVAWVSVDAVAVAVDVGEQLPQQHLPEQSFQMALT